MKYMALSALRRHAQDRHHGSTTIAKLANAYLAGYLNYDHDPTRNGEYNLLRKLSGSGLSVFFDVGANQGDWSNFVLASFPDADVHAFEVIPTTRERLKRHADPRVHISEFGLSDTDGHCQALVYEGNDKISTIITDEMTAIHKLSVSTICVETVGGDSYCGQNKIDSIDFLKIDVEGAEHKVLIGFGGMLAHGKVKIIQFEYGMANIYTKHLLRDYYSMIGDRYVIGRLWPGGVEFKDYDPREENFRSPNFVAVERSQQALIKRIEVA